MNKQLRRTIIAGNWKMNMLASNVKSFADELLPLVSGFKGWCDVVLCTPFTTHCAALSAFDASGVSVGAQNMSQHDLGAYTGEVSGSQIKDLGIEYVIIGHSERREYYGETDSSVNAKTKAAISSGLIPIVCVGETLHHRDIGVTFDLIATQVKAALHGIDSLDNVVVAYEPVWAIGTGKTATPQDAQAVCKAIRDIVKGLYSQDVANGLSILYGGSMNDKNAADLLSEPDIDGGLIGGASLKPEQFAVIVNAAK